MLDTTGKTESNTRTTIASRVNKSPPQAGFFISSQGVMDRQAARRAFAQQRRGAAARGIGWKLTFEQWLAWWGDDLKLRGRGTNGLQMQRFADTGPYALGNIRKGHPLDNARTAGRMRRLKNTMKAKAELEARLDAAEPGESRDWQDEDEAELQQMFGVRSCCVFDGNFRADK